MLFPIIPVYCNVLNCTVYPGHPLISSIHFFVMAHGFRSRVLLALRLNPRCWPSVWTVVFEQTNRSMIS